MTSEEVHLKGLRKDIVDMVYSSKEGHLPSAFSILEILYVLYKDFLKYNPINPESEDRDVFILSKGHGSQALYSILAHYGFFEKEKLSSFCKFNSIFGGHPDKNKVPGVEASTGSLGHGFPMALGMALAFKIQNKPNKVFALIGDGESEEGTIWESTKLAKNLGLDNLIVIMDRNKSQYYTQDFEYRKIWESFGWHSLEIKDGHNLDEIKDVLNESINSKTNNPKIIIAHTIKGKGISFIEDNREWHHKSPNEEEYKKIIEELK